jgi:hypothetical protein
LVLVVEIPVGSARVTEELWIGLKAKRFGLWGPFDKYIVARLPAKELRAELRRKGIVTLGDEDKAQVLARYVERQLNNGEALSEGVVLH